jgi:hypothetical protein
VLIFRTSCSKKLPNVNHHGRKNGIMKKKKKLNDVKNSKNEMPTPTRVSISK